MDSLISRVKGKLEVIRLEKRYAKRTHRAAYHGGAEYRDGEYVRNTNTNTNNITSGRWGGGNNNNNHNVKWGGTSTVREMRVGVAGWGYADGTGGRRR